jgi:2-polyprenyl-3-methyl-5-hydroxy-6-metoxy-1,4-benzoquinol methylase
MTDLFAEKAADYDQRPVPQQISEGVGRAIRERVRLLPTMTVMDVGAGTGLLTAGIAPYVAHIHAVDVSAAMLAQLAAKAHLGEKLTIHLHDLTHAPLHLQVDLAVSAMAMHHIRDTEALFRALFAHVRPGGWVALADLDREDGSFHPPATEGVFHAGFERSALRAGLEQAGFVDVDIQTATVVQRDGRDYPVFLATGRRG